MSNTKLVNKREESTKEYVDALQEEYSRLCAVRVDLAYKKPYSDHITLEEANRDLNRMLNNRRSKPSIFQDQVGYVIKKEYTEDRGVHLHAIFLYDGQKVQKDQYKAQQIGEYWSEQITKNKGCYHNCNIEEYKHNGVGVIDYRDSQKRENLDKVVSYLCKEEQDIAPVKSSQKERAFVRGIIPRSKGNIGRPRKESNL
ncbi:MAG: inovirus Gp2 family protein [Candidatus Cloacimonetes bacterium]|nr:inovirus Gp2 family protein [Candidatus Cloacimonadota bacterium]